MNISGMVTHEYDNHCDKNILTKLGIVPCLFLTTVQFQGTLGAFRIVLAKLRFLVEVKNWNQITGKLLSKCEELFITYDLIIPNNTT